MREVRETDHPLVGSVVASVELRMGPRAAERDHCVCRAGPDAFADGMKRFWKTPVKAPCDAAPSPMVMAAAGPIVLSTERVGSQHIHDADAWENVRAEGVDRASTQARPGQVTH